jgi:hypothetical protein
MPSHICRHKRSRSHRCGLAVGWQPATWPGPFGFPARAGGGPRRPRLTFQVARDADRYQIPPLCARPAMLRLMQQGAGRARHPGAPGAQAAVRLPGHAMACGLVVRVMTDDHTGCRAGPAMVRSWGSGIAPGGTGPAAAAAHTV